MKEQGTVKWFSAPKGYGFIKRSTGEDVFVHYSSILMDGYRKLQEGAFVEYEISEGPKGLQALNVVPIKPGEEELAPVPMPSAGEASPMQPATEAGEQLSTQSTSTGKKSGPAETRTTDVSLEEPSTGGGDLSDSSTSFKARQASG